jgi:hypothetical protein
MDTQEMKRVIEAIIILFVEDHTTLCTGLGYSSYSCAAATLDLFCSLCQSIQFSTICTQLPAQLALL